MDNMMKGLDELIPMILDIPDLGVLLVDREGIIYFANRFWGVFVEAPLTNFVGRPYLEVFPWLPIHESLNENREIGFLGPGAEEKLTGLCRPLKRCQEQWGAVCFLFRKDICDSCHSLNNYQTLIQELNAIFESSYDGIWVSDAQGITLRVNKAYERITGLEASQVVGQKARDIVNRGLVACSVTEQVIRQQRRTTIMNSAASGKRFLITGNPIFNDEGKLWRVVTNVRDITELLEIKQQLEELMARYEMELKMLYNGDIRGALVSDSVAMRKVLELVTRAARVDSTVLILGESGVGKGLIARLIHKLSSRSDQPFIEINCGAIPETLLESELFGYEKGAFTGASHQGKRGLFEVANGGTLFLDEVGDIPLLLQVKLLRTIQEQEVLPIGGIRPVKLNVRILAATNRELESMVKERKFREDLFYRLNVLPIFVPPLRERREDVPLLVKIFLEKYNKKHQVHKRASLEVIEHLTGYSWPGNVRELENLIEQLTVFCEQDEITLNNLPLNVRNLAWPRLKNRDLVLDSFSLKKAVEELEKSLIKQALELGQTTRKAAHLLGVDQSTIVRKAQKYNIIFPNL